MIAGLPAPLLIPVAAGGWVVGWTCGFIATPMKLGLKLAGPWTAPPPPTAAPPPPTSMNVSTSIELDTDCVECDAKVWIEIAFPQGGSLTFPPEHPPTFIVHVIKVPVVEKPPSLLLPGAVE